MQHIINSIRGGFEQFTIEVIDKDRNILYDDEAFTSGKACKFRVHVVKAIDTNLLPQHVADSLVMALKNAKHLLSCHLATIEESKKLKKMSRHKIDVYATEILSHRAQRLVDDLTLYIQHWDEIPMLEVHTESTMVRRDLEDKAPVKNSSKDIELTAEAVATRAFEQLSFQQRRYSN